MGRRDKLALGALVLFILSVCFEFADAWPLLAARLRALDWIILAVVHSVASIALYGLYSKAARGESPRKWEVLLAASWVLMTWAADLSLVARIGGR